MLYLMLVLVFQTTTNVNIINFAKIWQVEPCGAGSKMVLQTPASVRCLDVSASRSRIAVVDETSVCRVYSLPTGDLLYTVRIILRVSEWECGLTNI